MEAATQAHPGKRIEPWSEDETRMGLKGRTGHRWWVRGERPRGLQRPRGLRQQGYEWAHLFGAVRPATGDGFALVLPEVSTAAMQAFLDRFAATLAEGVHAVLVLDRAGWHGSRSLVVPPDVALVPLPPYAPELVWGQSCQALDAITSLRSSKLNTRRSEGSSPSDAAIPAAPLYSVDRADPNHDAAIRIGGEAPGRRAHSQPRHGGHVPGRVAATSDRYRRPSGEVLRLPELCIAACLE